MADMKPGKVIRVPDDVWALLTEKRKDGEKISSLVRRLLLAEDEARTFFVCPVSQVVLTDCKDIADARGRLVLLKKKLTEEPIPVREVI